MSRTAVNTVCPTAPRRARSRGLVAAIGVLLAGPFPLWPQSAPPVWAADTDTIPLYQGADLAEGQKLVAQHQCTACHQRKVGGNGSAIYRPAGRINSPGALRGMVEQCNTELNLAMFPEEVTSVAAVLNRDHYHFKP